MVDKLLETVWPHLFFYKEQEEIIQSVDDNDETIVVAGNQLGKDFVAAYIVLRTFLLSGFRTCRIVTTSVKDDHLRVLWGEIGRWIRSARVPLTRDKGGPLIYNHRELRKVGADGVTIDDISYVRGMVSERGEGLAGHHADITMAVVDEASGVDESVYDQVRTWAKRIFIFGNPNQTENFFYRGVEGGDILRN